MQVSPLLEVYEQFTGSAVRSLLQGGYVYSEFKFVKICNKFFLYDIVVKIAYLALGAGFWHL